MASLPLSLWLLMLRWLLYGRPVYFSLHPTCTIWTKLAAPEDDDLEPTPSLEEGLKALTIMQRFVEHQKDASIKDTTLLHHLEQQLNLQACRTCKQSTLDRWFLVSFSLCDNSIV
ncbi:hypothetical protein K469DRAFT_689192 [Zopfia rhizophila CBS 207.26]|uniref:Uncharacterized protein n=1 Tax=Zopfia rhizophila CBS 207.26 TaxID=1314779 RepID=A0A6A6ETP2_9PEZI|nr:hypothetical protein K469DRAFT_689192 [Zopfia rhizophila CBS 207.26]